MKKLVKNLLTLLFAMLLLFSLAACGSTGSEPDTNTPGEAAVNTPSANEPDEDVSPATRTITDGLGREVEIPAVVERIVPLGNTPRMISYLGLADKVVGIGECEIATSPIQAYAYPHIEKWSAVPNCGTDAMGETAFYPEEIVSAAPDVILCTYTEDVVNNIGSQTGIPIVAVAQGTLFGEDFNESLRILGDVCGVSGRAEEIIAFTQECLDDINARTEGIPDDNKPTVLAAGATFKGGHSIDGIYVNYSLFKILFANDVAADVPDQQGMSGVLVDKEQILAWNPEMIFFDSESMALVREDYAANQSYFNQLQAVTNGNLYQWPNSTWHWSNLEIPLVSAYYTGALLYPEAFEDVDFEQKASEIFDFFIGEPDYLETLTAAGAGYGKVTLGD